MVDFCNLCEKLLGFSRKATEELPGYHFVKWTNGAGKEVSRDLVYVPAKVNGLNVADTYTAHFEEDADVTIKSVSYTHLTLPTNREV